MTEVKSSAFRSLLDEMTRTTTRSVVESDMWNPMTVRLNDRVEDAFRMLVDNNYLSAPVVDAFGGYWGFIDMMDLVCFAVDLVDDVTLTERFDADYFRQQRRFKNALVSDLKHRPRRREVHPDFSLFHAFENMARFNQHRLAVLDPANNQVLGVLTQSMIIDWLDQRMDRINMECRQTPIWQIRPYTMVATVRETQRAIDAFRLMDDKDITGVAVVNEAGELIDNVSIRDLRGIGAGSRNFWRLFENVSSFKEAVKDTHPDAPASPQYVLRTDTFESVIRKMSLEKIHRVFVVRNHNDKRPLDIISQTDIMNFLVDKLTDLRPSTRRLR